MKEIFSKDGTILAFDQSGKGPAIILVGGSFEHRRMDSDTKRLAANLLLNRHFTVYHYDRRGRGNSTDTQPYAVEREIEDIEALIDEAGGQAILSGISSGAALALEATVALPNKLKGLAMYEPPYNNDEQARETHRRFKQELSALLASGQRTEAVGLFMKLMGMPGNQLEQAQQDPIWPVLESVVPTLANDVAILGEDASIPTKRASQISVPTIVMNGGSSSPFMRATAIALARAIPGAQHRSLEGQTHEVSPDALAPVLVEFFASQG